MKSKWRQLGVYNNQGSNGSRLFTFCDLFSWGDVGVASNLFDGVL